MAGAPGEVHGTDGGDRGEYSSRNHESRRLQSVVKSDAGDHPVPSDKNSG